MTIAGGLAALFSRDLTRLIQELQAFPSDEVLWQRAPGVKNSAGNLVLHLEGNLREYIGRQLGQVAYSRVRDREFEFTGVSRDDLIRRMEQVRELVVTAVSGLSDGDLAANYPELVLETPLSSLDFLVHLHGHLNFHLGQIDYLRRILTEGSAVAFAGL
jgi:DinB superfamily